MGMVVHTREQDKSERKPWRLLLVAALAALIVGILNIGQPAEDLLRSIRNAAHWHKASGDIVIVKIDNESLQQVGRWPWPRRYDAQLVDKLTAAGAKRIFFDVQFYSASDPEDDSQLASAIERSGRVVLPVNGSLVKQGQRTDEPPLEMFAKHAQLGAISWHYNYQNAVWKLPYALSYDGRPLPSYAALLAGRFGPAYSTFPVDYSLDSQSIPSLSAATVLAGKMNPTDVRGKDVIIGGTSNMIGDIYYVPDAHQMGGVYIHAIGAETLKAGRPLDLGWIPDFILSLAIAAVVLFRKRVGEQALVLGGTAAFLLAGTTFLEAKLIFLDIVPGLVVVIVAASAILWRYFRQRGVVNEISGLPNLIALRQNSAGRTKALIAARISNFAEIASALPAEKERQLVDQIVSRLTVGARSRVIYQGDGGIFAWFDEPATPFAHHLDALCALFRNPVKVAGTTIDVSISFGVEIGSSRSLANRLASALVAADEAAHHGLRWKYHDPQALEDASWKLSMLSQLDDAIDRGEVWIAYQPKLDLRTHRIIGAEALARWTHPDKGPIAATEFVATAEQHDRIGKLTAFVLEKAVAAAAALNRSGGDFGIAVNVSGKLLSDNALVGRIAILLDRYKLDPRHLTLELTESAALTEGGQALHVLTELRDLGLTISVDDYGTGFSTLDYLRTIPAAEIKVDQSFVKRMVDNRSDRVMVQSTIALAHSLGRRVVAEGVETRETLQLLAEMDCDIGQGFVIGRPMGLESLKRRVTTDSRGKAA